jgi:hypothetical protein
MSQAMLGSAAQRPVWSSKDASPHATASCCSTANRLSDVDAHVVREDDETLVASGGSQNARGPKACAWGLSARVLQIPSSFRLRRAARAQQWECSAACRSHGGRCAGGRIPRTCPLDSSPGSWRDNRPVYVRRKARQDRPSGRAGADLEVGSTAPSEWRKNALSVDLLYARWRSAASARRTSFRSAGVRLSGSTSGESFTVARTSSKRREDGVCPHPMGVHGHARSDW